MRFHDGMIVSHPSMVADINGNAWWVDPEGRTIERVREPQPGDKGERTVREPSTAR